MIQDIQPDRLCNAYQPEPPGTDSRILSFRGNEVCVRKGGRVSFPTFGALKTWCKKKGEKLPELIFLFTMGPEQPEKREPGAETSYFLADFSSFSENAIIPASDYEYVRLSLLRPRPPKAQVFAAATAWHLHVWYRDNRHCGRCGKTLVPDRTLRMLSCPSCGNVVFPKIAPAVIVGLTDGDRILMTKYAGREYKRYALIAGFTEIGETAEETVAREVMEEVGLKVKNIRYYKSQPWGFDANLLLGYFCELDGPDEIRLDEEELSTAEWINYRDIPDDAEEISLTREMMAYFKIQKTADGGKVSRYPVQGRTDAPRSDGIPICGRSQSR